MIQYYSEVMQPVELLPGDVLDNCDCLLYFFPADCSLSREKQIQKAAVAFCPDLNQNAASAFDVAKMPSGKPYFTSIPLCLSLTDLPEGRIVAVAEKEVGVDMEAKNRKIRTESIAGRFFHPDERMHLEKGECDFYTIWTAKESLVKYTGTGIKDNFGSFSVFQIPEHIHVYSLKNDLTVSVCMETDFNARMICWNSNTCGSEENFS